MGVSARGPQSDQAALAAKSVRLSSPLTEEGCGRAPGTPKVTLPV